jgi:hypothetical protein
MSLPAWLVRVWALVDLSDGSESLDLRHVSARRLNREAIETTLRAAESK